MPDGIEQSSCWRPTFLEVVWSRGINLQLPEVVVLLSDESVIAPRKLATDAEQLSWFDAAVSLCFGIKYPTNGVRFELVPLLETFSRRVFWREEEEHVVICYSEIENDVPVLILVTSGDITMEA